MRKLLRERASASKPGVGKIVIFTGVLRRNHVKHVHLVSPDGQFTHFVPAEWVRDVVNADNWWEAQKIARFGP